MKNQSKSNIKIQQSYCREHKLI